MGVIVEVAAAVAYRVLGSRFERTAGQDRRQIFVHWTTKPEDRVEIGKETERKSNAASRHASSELSTRGRLVEEIDKANDLSPTTAVSHRRTHPLTFLCFVRDPHRRLTLARVDCSLPMATCCKTIVCRRWMPPP